MLWLMEDLFLHSFTIKSKMKDYSVIFSSDYDITELGTFFLIDSNVFPLLGKKPEKYLLIEAKESNKSFESISIILQSLVEAGIKRNDVLVGIGGGIVQDITAFVSSIWMRGISWTFVPTTLLAQCDSCIGSKSSINFGEAKNILGTFNSPDKILIDTSFLHCLNDREIKSGLGEIIKLFVIDQRSFEYSDFTNDIETAIIDALTIKKRFIEEDEFDIGIRNILNYGHCFGHAFESASNFKIPHGIAVSLGMDIANFVSMNLGKTTQEFYLNQKKILIQNYVGYEKLNMDIDCVLSYLKMDKKHTKESINIIMPEFTGSIEKISIPNNESSWNFIRSNIETFLRAS